MERYSEYKDSGVQWLGEIPSHWEVYRIRYNYYLKGRIGWQGLKADEFCDNGPFLVTGTDFCDGKVNWDTCYHISQQRFEEAPEIHVKKGDLLMTKDGTVGKTAYIDEKPDQVSLNSHLLIIRPIHQDVCDNRYLQYLIMSGVFRKFTDIHSTGSIMASISQEKFSDFSFPLPTFSEQDAIVSYLDKVTTQIDTAISQQQKMIDLLNERKQIIINNAVTKGLDPNVKMKDSGVDWIGEICSSWNIFRLKHLLCGNLMYGANESAESEDPSFPRYIRITDIDENGKLKPETFRSLPPTKAEPYLLKKGDILFARSGATSGKTYLFDEDIKACFAGYLIKAQVSNKIISRYLMYYTRSGIYENWKNSIFIQATIQNIGADKYSNLRIPLPSISEQKEIINFLDSEMYKIDKVLDMHKCQISLLQERKQIIINDVVTGKVKVS